MSNKVTPRIPAGFMELLPGDQIQFNRMLDTIRNVYEKFGFTPIETPAIELSEVLLAKGGGETDQQVYRFTRGDSDYCLHFDLTVPLARYVAEHQNDLTFPFKRYQIQKVWRAERPQSGRFREFYQCDIDIIGSLNPIIDAEIPSVIYSVFTKLGFERFTIRINNRKILNGFLSALNLSDKSRDVLRAIDKLEKLGHEVVKEELTSYGLTPEATQKLFDFVQIKGSNKEVLEQLTELGINDEIFNEGLSELALVTDSIEKLGVPTTNFKIDLTIARGLDYYTGTVYETKLDDYPKIGSVCSGGRFDDLASFYTEKELPGVGISIGLTRLFDQLKIAGLLPKGQSSPATVLVAPMSEACLPWSLEITSVLRSSGINTDLYIDSAPLKTQLKYANKLGIPFTLIIGEDEANTKMVTIKNMTSGEQEKMTIEEVIAKIQE